MPEETNERPLGKPAQPSVWRFSKEVDLMAPKPGRDLGTITFTYKGDSILLRVIEGATRNAISFRGVFTNFSRHQPLNFHLRGNFVDLFEDLPSSPYDHDIEITYSDFALVSPAADTSSLRPTNARIIYTYMPSERAQGPDGALIKVGTETQEDVFAFLTGIKQGWLPILVVGVVAPVIYAIVAYIRQDQDASSRVNNVEMNGAELRTTVSIGNSQAEFRGTIGEGPATAIF